MKITDSARDALKQILAEQNADGLLVQIQETCCGKNPVFQLAAFDENDKPEEFNGIQMVIPEETADAVEDLIIDVINDELVVLNAVNGGCCGGHGHEGGCCRGHDHEDEDGGCCGGHGHDHEGGCCCH